MTRKVAEYTGTTNVVHFIEKLAERKNQPASHYFEEMTEAQVLAVGSRSVYDTLKEKNSAYLLPLLSRGKGAYAGTSDGHVIIGMLESYVKEQDAAVLTPHERHTSQNANPFFKPMLHYQANFMNFLSTVNTTGKPVPFALAVDSMNHYPTGSKIWSKAEGEEAAFAVRQFFTPMAMHDVTYTNRWKQTQQRQVDGQRINLSQHKLRQIQSKILSKTAM